MPRFTVPAEDVFLVSEDMVRAVPGGYGGPAVQRLAQFEDIVDRLIQEQQDISAEMDRLHIAGKEKSVKFRELFATKMLNNSMLSRFQAHGIGQE